MNNLNILKLLLSLLILLIFSSFSYSQNKISGKVVSEKKFPILGANIIVTKPNDEVIFVYAISDIKGEYSVTINSKLDSLQITVSHVGFKSTSKKILNTNQKLNFRLYETTEKLKEVFVKTPPLTKRGDTISYSVNAFTSQKDRVIADVLAKMPGIDILPDGKILYQGDPIQKYYIEGLDLLEGRYNLANNNLPASSVSKVQILENHQPIKLLDSLVFSNKTSLNIKLKKNITITGIAKLEVGQSPFLWGANITPMLFTKKQQMITSYQANNTGNDIAKELNVLTIDDLLNQFESKNKKQDWVTIQELSPPPFSEKRWLDNNANMFTSNYLLKIKKDVDLKVNLSYINDTQLQEGNAQTTFFTPVDTINIVENTKNKLFFNALKSKFILTKNIKKSYFKNTLKAYKYWDSKKGNIILNDKAIDQEVKNPFSSFSNKLKWIQPLGGKLTTINSIVTYADTPQNLLVSPGQYRELLNNGNLFNKIRQNVNLSNFFTNNAISLTKGYKNISFIPKIGFTLQNQKLNSDILLLENNNITKVPVGDFKNSLSFNKFLFYTILRTQYSFKKWKLDLETPLNIYKFKRVDVDLDKFQKLYRSTFEPKLSIKNDINAYWKTTFSLRLKNGFGDINQLYYGYILNNYRNIQQYDTPILESFKKKIALGISYRNPIKSVFLNAFYSYENSNQNLLFGNIIDNEGTSTYDFFEQNNTSNAHNISLRGSKYFSNLNTTLTLISNTSLESKEQLLNGILTNVTTKNIQLKAKLNTEIEKWMSLNYSSNFSIFNTKFVNKSFENIIYQEHLFNVSFYPSSNQYFGFDAEFYKNNYSNENQETYFLNFNYRFTVEKSKIDLELNCNNILNTKEFTTVLNDSFSYTQSTYELRPFQVLVGLKFNF